MASDGFVPTPVPITDWMVSVLFNETPEPDDTLLLPGCGTGNFAAAIQRCCSYRGHPCPDIYAVEPNDERARLFAERFNNADTPQRPEVPDASADQLTYTYPPDWSPSHDPVSMDITFLNRDFLIHPPKEQFDYVITNPPFVQYNSLDTDKRERYSEKFTTTTGRFNLYAPFVEQVCDHLKQDGQIACILPEDFLFSDNDDFRRRLREETIQFMRPLPTAVFPDHTIRTCMLSISRDPALGVNGTYIPDTWSYQTEVEAILRGLGVAESKLDNQIEAYLNRVKDLQFKIRMRRKTLGQAGGYDATHDPQTASRQADLGSWA